MRRTILILYLAMPPHLGLRAEAPVRSGRELKAFYAYNCVKCHGADGSARSPEGKRLPGMDFTDKQKMARESDAMMAKTIRKGIFFGVVMPPFKKRIAEAEALLLVREVLRKAERDKVITP
ncbi:MAG: cytochrome c [Geothrix sp.]|uniref:c-type cytochrome n=1 Tax=Geothrix sp. TaxID=1962974 RepID=UPI0017C0B8CF|nr:cytochrome c [Geothrix sp.]NWJ42262.1 cytochrome c [Geothrix sp.]WIL19771.1 MAG: cytochrome c [Geothrix sp.]